MLRETFRFIGGPGIEGELTINYYEDESLTQEVEDFRDTLFKALMNHQTLTIGFGDMQYTGISVVGLDIEGGA